MAGPYYTTAGPLYNASGPSANCCCEPCACPEDLPGTLAATGNISVTLDGSPYCTTPFSIELNADGSCNFTLSETVFCGIYAASNVWRVYKQLPPIDGLCPWFFVWDNTDTDPNEGSSLQVTPTPGSPLGSYGNIVGPGVPVIDPDGITPRTAVFTVSSIVVS